MCNLYSNYIAVSYSLNEISFSVEFNLITNIEVCIAITWLCLFYIFTTVTLTYFVFLSVFMSSTAPNLFFFVDRVRISKSLLSFVWN